MTSRWGRACRFATSQWRPPLFESGPPLQAPQEGHFLPTCCPHWTSLLPPSCRRQPHLPHAAFPLCDGMVSCVAQWSVPAHTRWAPGGRRGKDWFWVLSVPPPAPSQGGSPLSWNKSWKPRPRMRKDTKKRHKRETYPRGRLQVRVARVLRAANDRRKERVLGADEAVFHWLFIVLEMEPGATAHTWETLYQERYAYPGAICWSGVTFGWRISEKIKYKMSIP